MDIPQPGVVAPFKRRPGIQTTIYRHEPGTREFVFDERPPVGGGLEDQLGSNQQRMDLMAAAGGNFQNSPQYVGAAAQNESGWKALNDQMTAQAQQQDAQARQAQAANEAAKLAWESSAKKFGQDVLGSQIHAGTASQQDIEAAGGSPNIALLATELGLDKTTGLSEGIGRLRALGKLPLVPGSSIHRALLAKHGPELQARLTKQPAYWYETPSTPFAPGVGTNIGDRLLGGIPALSRYMGGTPSAKQQGEAEVAELFGQPATPAVPGPAAPQPEIRLPVQSATRPGVKAGAQGMQDSRAKPGIQKKQQERVTEMDRIKKGGRLA